MRPARQRVALVTGSSRGLGRVIAGRLARDGLAVAVNGLHADGQLLEVVRAIQQDRGVADAFAADVTDEAQVTDLVAAVADRFGPVDVLVLNATGSQPEGVLESKAAYLATVPAGRMGTPEDIAHAVSFFATEAAGFVTGQRLVVDGGRALHD